MDYTLQELEDEILELDKRKMKLTEYMVARKYRDTMLERNQLYAMNNYDKYLNMRYESLYNQLNAGGQNEIS